MQPVECPVSRCLLLLQGLLHAGAGERGASPRMLVCECAATEYVHVYAAWCVRKGVDLDYIISKYAFRSSCMRSGGRCMSHLQCVWYM